MMLAPTTVEPSAETPQASLYACPPGRSPRPTIVGRAVAAPAAAQMARTAALVGRRRRDVVGVSFIVVPRAMREGLMTERNRIVPTTEAAGRVASHRAGHPPASP